MSNADWVYMQVGATLSVCLTVILFAQNALRERKKDRNRIAELGEKISGLEKHVKTLMLDRGPIEMAPGPDGEYVPKNSLLNRR